MERMAESCCQLPFARQRHQAIEAREALGSGGRMDDEWRTRLPIMCVMANPGLGGAYSEDPERKIYAKMVEIYIYRYPGKRGDSRGGIDLARVRGHDS